MVVAVVRWQAALASLGNYLVCSEAPQLSGLILVLAGDFYGPRVLKAAELASRGYARRVLISGTPYQGRPEGEFAIAFLAKQGYATDSFASFGHRAHSTIEEAIALRPELERRGVKRVLLVTSPPFAEGLDRVSACLLGHPLHLRARSRSLLPHRSGGGQMLVPGDASSRRLFLSEWGKIGGSLLLAYPEYLFSQWIEKPTGAS